MTMNRRRLIQISLLAALAPGSHAPAATKPKKTIGSPKKGLCITTRGPDWGQKLVSLRCKWFYSWGATAPVAMPPEIAFTPMIWGYHGNREAIINAAAAAKKSGIKEMLGFNEPDEKSQSNMTVEKALESWKILQESGLRLGSPGCVHPDNAWMKSFMNEAEKRALQVDFVCVHSYGAPDSAALVRRLHAIHKLYKKPIWITEFAVGDWKAKSAAENQFKPDKVLRFMEDVLPQLDKLDFVERYAWFPSNLDNKALGTSALFDAAGKLTRLGECYRDH